MIKAEHALISLISLWDLNLCCPLQVCMLRALRIATVEDWDEVNLLSSPTPRSETWHGNSVTVCVSMNRIGMGA